MTDIKIYKTICASAQLFLKIPNGGILYIHTRAFCIMHGLI